MEGIKKYEYKYVELTTTDDKVFIGDIIEVEPPWEENNEYWSLALERDDGIIIGFKDYEIKKIKEV